MGNPYLNSKRYTGTDGVNDGPDWNAKVNNQLSKCTPSSPSP